MIISNIFYMKSYVEGALCNLWSGVMEWSLEVEPWSGVLEWILEWNEVRFEVIILLPFLDRIWL